MKRPLLYITCLYIVYGYATEVQNNQGISVTDALSIAFTNNSSLNIEFYNYQTDFAQIRGERAAFNPTLKVSCDDIFSRDRLDASDQIIYKEKKSDLLTQKYNLSIDQKFKSGLVVQPFLTVSSVDPRTLLRTSISEPYGDRDPTTEVDFGIGFSLPLLKGAGRGVAAANLSAAKDNATSSELKYYYTISAISRDVLNSYWNYRAASEMIAIQTDAVSAAKSLLSDIEKLVNADQRPASDLDQLKANLLEQEAKYHQSEKNFRDARIALGNLLGISPQETIGLPQAITELPYIQDEIRFSDERIATLITKALVNRFDFSSAQKKVDAADILLKAARRNIFPNLAINGNFNYSILNEPKPKLYSNENEYDMQIGISSSYPLLNDAAISNVSRYVAVQKQALINKKDIENRIRTGVWAAVKGFENALSQFQKESQSVKYYQKAAENERKKLSMGMATVIDVVSTEQNYRTAQISELSARVLLANALTDMRYETGELIIINAEKKAMPVKNLLELPE